MSISVNIPEISALRSRVEETFGESLRTHNAFIALMDRIDSCQREHLSESTLERLWGYSTRGVDAISLRTLDVLSRYVGAVSWTDFCAALKADSPVESEEFSGESILSARLEPGMRLQLGWLPDRLITVVYMGRNRFVIEESLNSSLCPGDSFECLQIQVGQPLYLDRFRRAGSSSETRYVAGERNGLTVARLL
ncbi:MAG: hypothetical protein K5651_08425 [Bacteroidales bacterium]|nr:hypothetical protein [Bacteroidales bacterium]